MQRTEWLSTDLQKPIRLQSLKTDLFLNDDTGNMIGVNVMDGGTEYSITGNVVCYMIRPDTTTLTIAGTASGNQAMVTLPKEAYYYSGRANFVIKVEGNGNKVTLAAFTALIYRDRSDRIADEERIIPSLSEIMTIVDQINNMTMTVQTLPAGSAATGNLTSIDGHYNLAFGIPRGTSGNEPDVQTATLLAANWSGDEPASQTVTVQGISAGSVIIVGITESATDTQYVQASLARLFASGSGTNQLTVVANAIVPTVDIPITIVNLSESGASLVDYTQAEITDILNSVFE